MKGSFLSVRPLRPSQHLQIQRQGDYPDSNRTVYSCIHPNCIQFVHDEIKQRAVRKPTTIVVSHFWGMHNTVLLCRFSFRCNLVDFLFVAICIPFHSQPYNTELKIMIIVVPKAWTINEKNTPVFVPFSASNNYICERILAAEKDNLRNKPVSSYLTVTEMNQPRRKIRQRLRLHLHHYDNRFM